jgi:uncharacterized protein (TIGR03032 family)
MEPGPGQSTQGTSSSSASKEDPNPKLDSPPAVGSDIPASEPVALPPLRSVHTENFAAILDELGISLLVSTYQAGKVVLLRADQGVVNTHFRNFNRPMGLAVDGDRLAIGTGLEVWEYHNVPAVAKRMTPDGKNDACFLPRRGHCTGDVQIHEMAFGWARDEGQGRREEGRGERGEGVEKEIWFVNTRFSCLCTIDRNHSFVPRWWPPFISALAPEDRCHLNGLAMVQGRPAFVTALGETDTHGGWRVNKKDGGILIEVETGRTMARGLSMPHSPRWYDGRLWLLESGTGSLGYINPTTSEYVKVAETPGFTRGLDFCGPLAFVGLSQVRETAVFSGIPITEQNRPRHTGVWVVNITNGRIIAFLEFQDALQEIFAVQALPGKRFPELVNDDPRLIADSFVLPTDALAAVAEPFRFPAPESATKNP